MDISTVKALADQFRQAIEACRFHLGPEFFNFPHGSCGAASMLLGTYLKAKEQGDFDYILGSYFNSELEINSSHGWLQNDNLIVDITADQFPEIREKIIVEFDSAWHKNLEGRRLQRANIEIYNTQNYEMESLKYERILIELSNITSSRS